MFPVRLCLCIVLVATCSARPNWHKDYPDDDLVHGPPEEKVNLHHTLKDLQHSASKAVKDVHKYIHQQLNTAVKTSVEKIGKPIATVVLGPAILMKETLDALSGKRRPPPEEDISSWCPSCLEDDNPSQIQTSSEPYYRPDWYDNNYTTPQSSSPPPNEDLLNEETPRKDESSMVTRDPISESDFINPKTDGEFKGRETDIDIRFGKK